MSAIATEAEAMSVGLESVACCAQRRRRRHARHVATHQVRRYGARLDQGHFFDSDAFAHSAVITSPPRRILSSSAAFAAATRARISA